VDPTTGRPVGRNETCPCGSGKKYKHCCLDKDEAKQRAARARAAEKEAKAGEKEAKAAEKEGEKADAAESAGQVPPKPRKPQTYQPWKKSAATNTHAFQRMSTPRKVGGS
jgi:SEC-C motif